MRFPGTELLSRLLVIGWCLALTGSLISSKLNSELELALKAFPLSDLSPSSSAVGALGQKLEEKKWEAAPVFQPQNLPFQACKSAQISKFLCISNGFSGQAAPETPGEHPEGHGRDPHAPRAAVGPGATRAP